MKTKRYWLRGLLTGIVIYAAIVLFINYTPSGNELFSSEFLAWIIGFYLLPVIPFGWLIGWIWGRIKKKKAAGLM